MEIYKSLEKIVLDKYVNYIQLFILCKIPF